MSSRGWRERESSDVRGLGVALLSVPKIFS